MARGACVSWCVPYLHSDSLHEKDPLCLSLASCTPRTYIGADQAHADALWDPRANRAGVRRFYCEKSESFVGWWWWWRGERERHWRRKLELSVYPRCLPSERGESSMVSRTMSRFSFSFWNKAIRVDDSGTVMETSFSEISRVVMEDRERENL